MLWLCYSRKLRHSRWNGCNSKTVIGKPTWYEKGNCAHTAQLFCTLDTHFCPRKGAKVLEKFRYCGCSSWYSPVYIPGGAELKSHVCVWAGITRCSALCNRVHLKHVLLGKHYSHCIILYLYWKNCKPQPRCAITLRWMQSQYFLTLAVLFVLQRTCNVMF